MTAPKKNKGPTLVADFRALRPGTLGADGLRALALKNPESFMARFEDLVASGEITLAKIGSLRGLFHALGDVQVKSQVDVLGQVRELTTSAFPLAMGNLMVAALNAAYLGVPTIGDELVTDLDSNKRFTHMAKLHHEVHDKVDVKEAEEYPLIGAGESFTVIGSKRRGFRWKLTQEALDEDDVGVTARFLQEAGEYAAELNEEQVLDRVTDRYGSAATPKEPYVYRPQGTGTALFTTTADTQRTLGSRKVSNVLTSATQLEALRQVLVGQKNTRGRKIDPRLNSEAILLLPDALAGIASTLTRSEMTPGTANEVNPWGPRGLYQPKLISSVKLDDISTGEFYMGTPKRVFTRKWKLRVESVSVARDPLEFLRTRCAYEARVGWDMEIGATDLVGWVQSIPGATRAF
jgi:hypothetical protein